MPVFIVRVCGNWDFVNTRIGEVFATRKEIQIERILLFFAAVLAQHFLTTIELDLLLDA